MHKNIKTFLILMILHVVFCVQASSSENLNQLVLTGLNQQGNSIIDREEEAFEFSELLRRGLSVIDRKLRENYVKDLDRFIVEEGYRAMLKMGRRFSTQLKYEDVVLDDQFFIDFFDTFKLAISASIVEAELSQRKAEDGSCNSSYVYDSYLQNYINMLLDDDQIKTQSAFYQYALKVSPQMIDAIHSALISIIALQEEVVGILEIQGRNNAIAI